MGEDGDIEDVLAEVSMAVVKGVGQAGEKLGGAMRASFAAASLMAGIAAEQAGAVGDGAEAAAGAVGSAAGSVAGAAGDGAEGVGAVADAVRPKTLLECWVCYLCYEQTATTTASAVPSQQAMQREGGKDAKGKPPDAVQSL